MAERTKRKASPRRRGKSREVSVTDEEKRQLHLGLMKLVFAFSLYARLNKSARWVRLTIRGDRRREIMANLGCWSKYNDDVLRDV